jgi:malate synthase
MKTSTAIPSYDSFLSPALKARLLAAATPVNGDPDLRLLGVPAGLEGTESLRFLTELFDDVRDELNIVLTRRTKDRRFIDERTRALAAFNRDYNRTCTDLDYRTVLGLEDGEGRIVVGPRRADYAAPGGAPVAPIPAFLQGPHVTLFGPPDSAKLSINAMNAYHRKLKDEPAIVEELLATHDSLPKWGADDEDSKTPLHEDLVDAGVNLTKCLEGTLELEENGRRYELAAAKRALPIKRFPGLALPCTFLFYKGGPVPLHLYDFALHFFRNWHNPEALAFYVPKLENEEEARYVRIMIEAAERRLKKTYPSYAVGSIRLMIVLENPRAIFRTHEIMDELYPYFAGASLGWHDFLASTARLFKEDPNYRIPVKADPDIVIKYIKASHDLLADVVGSRGGIKVGGMYGILPTATDLRSPSYQLTLKGFIRDVVTQLKRGLSGFWVAHPDFVRLGLALVEAWKFYQAGDRSRIESLVRAILDEASHAEVLVFIHGPDIPGLDKRDARYPRALIVADLKESDFISNNHPDEIRYNVFQSLQYLTDWLAGNGCVALPALVAGSPVRVMDDLATAERSRWEVWHEVYHGRFELAEFLRIAHEELAFIRKDRSDGKKIVQVKWDARTAKWYPVAFTLMVKLMTDRTPVEFATELLLPFTIPEIRGAADPLARAREIDPEKFAVDPYTARFNYFFEHCGALKFAKKMAKQIAVDEAVAEKVIRSFDKASILEAAAFHGDIGEAKETLDKLASVEQAKVLTDDEKIRVELRELGHRYRFRFGMKYLVSAQGKSGAELLADLRARLENTEAQELDNARSALWEITKKRLRQHPLNRLRADLDGAFRRHGIESAQLTILTSSHDHQTLTFGGATQETFFEVASLSKAVASAFAIEYFDRTGISLETPVAELLAELPLPGVSIAHLMNHSALNLHYVNGVPADRPMPPIDAFLRGNAEYGYDPVTVINPPGEKFSYSGGGYLVLEKLIEKLSGKPVAELTRPFLDALEMEDWTFAQDDLPGKLYALGITDHGAVVAGGRKRFPAFAAGATGTSHAMAHFLEHLEEAFQNVAGSGGISHDTARRMLHGTDKGCRKFMNALMGLGIFVVEAGDNRFMLHQGANDGFRAIFLHCFAGPDRGKGLVSLCNGDLKGVLFNAEVTQLVLREFGIRGVDALKFKTTFSAEGLPPEQVVNLGYKGLVLDAFERARPEAITNRGPRDPRADHNRCVGAEVIACSNDLFARAENLLSEFQPTFDPELFGTQGKVMDSWESVRHNIAGVDTLEFRLRESSVIRYVSFSTKYHTGNFAPEVRLEGKVGDQWQEFLPRTRLAGHSELNVTLPLETLPFREIRVSMYPDGGLTRLGLFADVPDPARFDGVLRPCADPVPATVKPLNLDYRATPAEIAKNWASLRGPANLASAALGAAIVSATDEHYSPAAQLLSPFSPINMFDGLESARSRTPGHFEEVVVRLARPGALKRLELDFTWFVNNNPLEVTVEGLAEGKWVPLLPKTNVKSFRGGTKMVELGGGPVVSELRLRTYPCGGLNRLRAWER